jgi:hypothetical protein
VEQVLRLYKEPYYDPNIRHFREKLKDEHGIKLSYTWVQQALQGAGLVAKQRKRGKHGWRRERRPMNWDVAAHRWKQTSMVWRSALARSDRDPG